MIGIQYANKDIFSDKTTHDWRAEFKRLDGAYALRTIRGYFADLACYEAWALGAGREPFPASPAQLCAFLDDQGRQPLAISTIRRRIHAIRKEHRLLRLPDPTGNEDVALTLRRLRRARFARPVQAKGMTAEYLERFLASEPDTPTGLRNRAMLALGDDLLTRRSELVALRDGDVTPAAHGTYRFLIRRSKADPFGEGRTAFCVPRTARLIDAWRHWRGSGTDWLFCPI